MKNGLIINTTDIHCPLSAFTFISPPCVQREMDKTQNLSMWIPANKSETVDPKHASRSLSHPKAPVFLVLVVLFCCLNSYSLKHCNLCSFKVSNQQSLNNASFQLYTKTVFIYPVLSFNVLLYSGLHLKSACEGIHSAAFQV